MWLGLAGGWRPPINILSLNKSSLLGHLHWPFQGGSQSAALSLLGEKCVSKRFSLNRYCYKPPNLSLSPWDSHWPLFEHHTS